MTGKRTVNRLAGDMREAVLQRLDVLYRDARRLAQEMPDDLTGARQAFQVAVDGGMRQGTVDDLQAVEGITDNQVDAARAFLDAGFADIWAQMEPLIESLGGDMVETIHLLSARYDGGRRYGRY